MKIKLDENIPQTVAFDLSKLGHDIDTVASEQLIGESDSIIWNAAQKEGRFLITQDLDFSDIRKFAPGTHHGILLVRFRMPGRKIVSSRIISIFENELTADWHGCFVILSDSKIRILRPHK